MHAGSNGPVDPGDEPGDGGRQRAIEHFDGVELRVRSLLENRGGDRGAVSETIDVAVVSRTLLTASVDSDAAGDAVGDVRMVDVDAAVDDGDADRSTRAHTGLAQSGALTGIS